MLMRFAPTLLFSTLLLALASEAGAQDRPDIRPRADLREHRDRVRFVEFLPDGEHLVSAADDGKIKIWDIAAKKSVRTLMPRHKVVDARQFRLNEPRRINCLTLNKDGSLIAEVAAEPSRLDALRLWSPGQSDPVRVITDKANGMRAVAFTVDGKTLVASEPDRLRWGDKLVLYDVETGVRKSELTADRLAARFVEMSPDGKWLVTAGGPHVHIWDWEKREIKHHFSSHEKGLTGIAISRDSKFLATASAGTHVRVWNLEEGTRDIEFEHEQDGVESIAFSKSGYLIATGGRDKTIKLWKRRSGTLFVRMMGHLDAVEALDFSPDGKTLASGSRDRNIALWDIDEPDAPETDEEIEKAKKEAEKKKKKLEEEKRKRRYGGNR